jgi:phospholipid transport system substrate-binding protein
MVRLLPLALALVSLSFHEAWATTPTAELRAFFADATLILTDPETDGKHAERLGAIRAITRQVFDVREAAKLALGSAWRDRSEAEREEFAHLYGDFLERAFITWIAARAQIDGGPRVSFLGESVGGGRATVRTTVLGRNGRDLPLEYRMVHRGDRWAARDVVIDGVSLAANYRAQFTRVIQSSSYPDLVQQLRDKVAPPPPALIASAEPPAPSLAPAPVARERAARASEPMPPGEPAPETPPGETRIEPGRPRTTASASPEAEISRPRSYWVQVAAFRSFEAAMRLAALLRAEKPVAPDRWAVVMEPGPALARVRVGPFADRAEATSNLRELESRGFKPFIAEEGRDPR